MPAFLSRFGRWFSPPPRKTQPVRLAAERLEGRDVPASYTWTPADANSVWSDVNNWRVPDRFDLPVVPAQPPGVTPGVADDVAMVKDSLLPSNIPGLNYTHNCNLPCIVDLAPTVRSLTMLTGYTSSVKVQNSLSISSSLYQISGGAVTGYIDPTTGAITRGAVALTGSAKWYWKDGAITNVSVDVQRAAGTYASFLISSGGGGVTTMTSAALTVHGLLSWDNQNVTVVDSAPGQPASLVDIKSGGEFNIDGGNTFWGGDPAYLDVFNYGTTTVNGTNATTTHTIKGDYVNWFKTTVDYVKLEITALAEQGNGVFALKNDATVQVSSSTGVLGIRGGSIIGQGTVAGNLVLGNDNGTGSGMISPGFDTFDGNGNVTARGVGTITVSGFFATKSASSVMQIDVLGDASFDKVLVGGYAALGGILSVTAPTTYKPAVGTTHTFLVTQGGITGDFGSKVLPTHIWQHPSSNKPIHWWARKTPDWYSLIAETEPGQQPPGP